MHRVLGPIVLASVMMAAPATGERAEAVSDATVIVTKECPVTDQLAIASETDRHVYESFFGPFGGILASLGGDLAGAAVTALGNALDKASQEKGFVAEGSSSFYFHSVEPKTTDHPARILQNVSCLILYQPSQSGSIDDLANDQRLKDRNGVFLASGHPFRIFPLDQTQKEIDRANRALDLLKAAGVQRAPSVYVEAALLTMRDGIVVRPLLVWYRERLPGAPKGETAAELHVTFATPASGDNAIDIGTPFAAVRIKLPRISPGKLYDWTELASYKSVVVPSRPTSGSTDTTLTRFTGDDAAVATRKVERAGAERALAAAQRKYDAQQTADNKEAVVVAAEDVVLATIAFNEAKATFASLHPLETGSTNVKARFVIIRDANAFGQAIAKAILGKSDAVKTAVTTALTPAPAAPAWAATDTAYLEATNAVAAKERELTAATQAGDSAAVVRLSDELRIVKARANEAAVASKRPIPYPGLI